MTAKEKLKAHFYNGKFVEINSGDEEEIAQIMIEFAKYHVETALKFATSDMEDVVGIEQEEKNVILGAYPSINIV